MKQLISGIVMLIGLVWASVVTAQTVFIQIEAHSSLNVAQDRTRAFAGRFRM